MLERYEHEREMKKLKEEIVQEVLSRISVSIDVSDVIEEIEELRRAIDSLGERR
jgi:DNA-binding winged helix-turn-helix (wHTH) protein